MTKAGIETIRVTGSKCKGFLTCNRENWWISWLPLQLSPSRKWRTHKHYEWAFEEIRRRSQCRLSCSFQRNKEEVPSCQRGRRVKAIFLETCFKIFFSNVAHRCELCPPGHLTRCNLIIMFGSVNNSLFLLFWDGFQSVAKLTYFKCFI